MTPETFLANFGALAESPEGPKRLRRLILEQAVRGRLSHRDPDDEPVEVLLQRIALEREQASRNGRISKTLRLPSMDDEPPFEIPAEWRWVRWGSLILSTGSGWSPQCESRPRTNQEWGVLKVSAVSWDEFNPEENKALPLGDIPDEGYVVREGDFLMSRANTSDLVGRSVVVTKQSHKLIMSDKIVRCNFSMNIDRMFINYFNRTSTARTHYIEHATGTSNSMKNISREVILSVPVPLPPLAEQKRIVAKVDQLMALCDELERQQNKKQETRALLTRSALDALTSAEGPEQFVRAWRRVAHNFEVILSTPEGVEDLRQTILDLALSGQFSHRAKFLPWPEKALGELAQVITKGTTPTTLGLSFTASGVRFIKVENEKRGVILHESIKDFITKETHDALRRSQLQAGDLLFSIAGTIGETCVVKREDLPANTNQALAIIRVTPEILDPPFLRIQLDSFVAHQIKKKARGGAMNNVSLSDLRALPVRVPPLEEQKRIVTTVDRLMAQCNMLDSKLRDAEKGAARLAEAMTAAMVA